MKPMRTMCWRGDHTATLRVSRTIHGHERTVDSCEKHLTGLLATEKHIAQDARIQVIEGDEK